MRRAGSAEKGPKVSAKLSDAACARLAAVGPDEERRTLDEKEVWDRVGGTASVNRYFGAFGRKFSITHASLAVTPLANASWRPSEETERPLNRLSDVIPMA